jgi:hypothetical protein
MATMRSDRQSIIEIGAATAMRSGGAGPIVEFWLSFAGPGIDQD